METFIITTIIVQACVASLHLLSLCTRANPQPTKSVIALVIGGGWATWGASTLGWF